MDFRSSEPVSTLRTSDPEQLVAGVRGANFDACQLDSRPVPSELARVIFTQSCLDMAHVGPAMLFSGAMPAECYALIFVLACPGFGRSFNFRVEHTDGYMGFFAPGSALDAMTPAGYRNGTLTLPAAALRAGLRAHFEYPPDALLARDAAMRIPAAERSRLCAVLRATWQMMWDPGRPLAVAAMRRQCECNVQGAFFAALHAGSAVLLPPPPRRLAGRHRHLRQARDFFAAHAHEPIYLDDLCAALDLTHRSVENLFQDFLGISPIVYLRHHRLHGVRRSLIRATPAPGAVKRAALEWGFWHQGHFSHDYYALFGEHAAQTLSR